MFEFLDKVIYINLEHRVDRRESIETELTKHIPREKIVRFDAIYNIHYGHIGCSESHIESLKMAIANNWENVLIVEDDAIWSNYEKGYAVLQQLIQQPYDVICFGSVFASIDPTTYRMTKGQTSTAYLVNRAYYSTLLKNFEEGLSLLKQYYYRAAEFCIDQYWKRLQSMDRWYLIEPPLMYQKACYSDISKMNVDYSEFFKVK